MVAQPLVDWIWPEAEDCLPRLPPLSLASTRSEFSPELGTRLGEVDQKLSAQDSLAQREGCCVCRVPTPATREVPCCSIPPSFLSQGAQSRVFLGPFHLLSAGFPGFPFGTLPFCTEFRVAFVQLKGPNLWELSTGHLHICGLHVWVQPTVDHKCFS